MNQIREKFIEIEDTRHASYVEYNLVDVLILVMIRKNNIRFS